MYPPLVLDDNCSSASADDDHVKIALIDFSFKDHPFFSQQYNQWLLNKFRSAPNIPFSLRMNKLAHTLSVPSSSELPFKPSNEYCYDIVISYRYNMIIMSGNYYIHLFDYSSKKYLKSIPVLNVEVHEMEIDSSGLNLYLTGSWEGGFKVAKFYLPVFLATDAATVDVSPGEGSCGCLWTIGCDSLQNLWGIGLYEIRDKVYVYAMDYGTGLHVFDSENGERVDHKVPKVEHGYGVTFTPEREMIITSSSQTSAVEIYTFDEELEEWKLKLNCLRIQSDSTPYGVFYEASTQRIFVVDTVARSISIFNKQDLTRLDALKLSNYGCDATCYGIMIDKKTGILYLADVVGSVLLFD